MNSHLKKFIVRGLIISLILLITGTVLFTTVLNDFFNVSHPLLLIVIFFTTVIFHRYLISHAEKDTRKFPAKFLGVSGIKMGFYLIIIIVYSILQREHAVSFLLCFIVLYLIFSVFEVISIVNYIKTGNKQ